MSSILSPSVVRTMPIDARAVKMAREHIGEGRANYKWNADVFQRLEACLSGGGALNRYDENMVRHEIMESMLMKEGMDYQQAHQRALDLLGHKQQDIIDPALLTKYGLFIGPDGKLRSA